MIPPKNDAEFVMRMETILDLYALPYDPSYPVVCFDETNKQLTKEIREPLPIRPGQPEKYDYSYERNGVANLFMFFEPLAGIRYLEVTKTKTRIDYANMMKLMVDKYYSHAKQIRLVMDNYSTHKLKFLYEVFQPAEARRIIKKIDPYFTPVHASWLNTVECEFSVLIRQCLNRRIGDMNYLKSEVKKWQRERNHNWKKVDWQFTTIDARRKLKKLYPTILP